MRQTTPRFARARGGIAVGLCGLALLAACEAKLPTAADVAGLDVSQAAVQGERLGLIKTDSLIYTVNGVRVTPAQARALAPKDSIASINVSKSNGQGRIEIVTSLARIVSDSARRLEATMNPEHAAHADSVIMRVNYVGHAAEAHDSVRTTSGGVFRKTKVGATSALTGGGAPLMMIDGVRATDDQLHGIDPKSILSVEVIKGAAARASYPEPDAANGVILVVTKRPK